MSQPSSESSPRAATRPPTNLAGRLLTGRMRWLILLILIGPFVALQAPLEVGRWKLAAAIQARADGQKDRAYGALADAMQWMPNKSKLYLHRAAWRLADGQSEEAFADADTILQISGDSAYGLTLHGNFMQAVGRHADAVADWKKIDQISQRTGSPSRAEALNGLAYFQAVGKIELDEALAHANEALQLNDPRVEKQEEHPDHIILDTRGYLHYLKGNYQAALQDLTIAITKMHAHEEALRKKYGSQGPLPLRYRRLLDNEPRLGASSSTRAVTYYHRALVLKALGKDQLAEAELARVRALIGREPDESLF